jgi:CheY-like chemotaxis protein
MAYTFGGLMVTSVRRPPLVLLVDDDEYIHALVARTLRRLPAETLAVRSGRDGLLVARQRPPDLILLDLALPDVDGLTLIDALRTVPATRDVPIVIVSGLAGLPALRSAGRRGRDEAVPNGDPAGGRDGGPPAAGRQSRSGGRRLFGPRPASRPS